MTSLAYNNQTAATSSFATPLVVQTPVASIIPDQDGKPIANLYTQGIVAVAMITVTAGTGNLVLTASSPGQTSVVATTVVGANGTFMAVVGVRAAGTWTFTTTTTGLTISTGTILAGDLMSLRYQGSSYIFSTITARANTSAGSFNIVINANEVDVTGRTFSNATFLIASFYCPLVSYGIRYFVFATAFATSTITVGVNEILSMQGNQNFGLGGGVPLGVLTLLAAAPGEDRVPVGVGFTHIATGAGFYLSILLQYSTHLEGT